MKSRLFPPHHLFPTEFNLKTGDGIKFWWSSSGSQSRRTVQCGKPPSDEGAQICLKLPKVLIRWRSWSMWLLLFFSLTRKFCGALEFRELHSDFWQLSWVFLNLANELWNSKFSADEMYKNKRKCTKMYKEMW